MELRLFGGKPSVGGLNRALLRCELCVLALGVRELPACSRDLTRANHTPSDSGGACNREGNEDDLHRAVVLSRGYTRSRSPAAPVQSGNDYDPRMPLAARG